MIKTRTFKSGNSVALRLPKALGIEAGREMRVREEQGRYVLEPVDDQDARLDLTGIYGAGAGLKLLGDADREIDSAAAAPTRE